MADVQLTDDMKMENFNEFMRMLRKNARYVMDIDEEGEAVSDTAEIALEEKLIINNYGAFLYNNELIANREDVYDTLVQIIERDSFSDIRGKCKTEHLDEFIDEHYEGDL